MTLIDLFREFSAVATSDNYSGSSRILYYTLLYIWNERRRPSEVSVAQKQLYALTGLPPATFVDAVRYLSSRHWIKRLKSRNRTTFVYQLNEGRTEAERAAGVPLSPAQRTTAERRENPPQSGFSDGITQKDRDYEQSIQRARIAGDDSATQSQDELRRVAEAARRAAELDSDEMPDD